MEELTAMVELEETTAQHRVTRTLSVEANGFVAPIAS